MAEVQKRFSDGSTASYSRTSQVHPYLLYCGSKHDRTLRESIAQAAGAAGFSVKDVDGPFGTVIVESASDRLPQLRALPGVTGATLDDPCGCLTQDQCPLGIHT